MGLVVDSYRFAAAGFDPDDFGSDLKAWYDVSVSGSVTITSSRISGLDDLSGNSKNLSQGTAAARPVVSSAARNGLDTALTDTSAVQSLGGAVINLAQPLTVFCSASIGTPAQNSGLFDTSAGDRMQFGRNAATWRMFAGSLADFGTGASTWSQFTVVFNGSSSILRIDGSVVSSGVVAGSQGLGTLSLLRGTDQPVADVKELGEFFVVAGAITGSDLTDAEDYLATKWGTP